MNYPTQASLDSDSENPLKPAIRAAFSALSADFGERFSRQFRPTDGGQNVLTPSRWQYRLMHLLGGMQDMPDVVIEAVNAIAKRCGDCPTLVEIVAECRNVRAARYRAAEERREAEHYAALPPPSRTARPGEIAGMCRDVLDHATPGKKSSAEDHEAWLERKRQKVRMHEQLIAADMATGKIRTPLLHGNPACAISGCQRPGTMTTSTTGIDTWYCSEHLR